MSFELFMECCRLHRPGKALLGTCTKEGIMSAVVSSTGEEILPSDVKSFQEEAEAVLVALAMPNLEDCREKQKERIKATWENEISNVGMPVSGYDFNVDFDIGDQLIWQGGVELLDPDALEVEVRAIDNAFHVIPRDLFLRIPQLQRTYYVQILQKKWALQKAVDSCESPEEIEGVTWV